MKAYQQVLRGYRSSERGIRYRILTIDEVDAIRRKAALLVAQSPVPDELKAEERRALFLLEGVKAMLVAVTKAAVPRPPLPPKEPGPPNADGSPGPMVQPEPVEPPLADDALWQPVDLGTLTAPGPFTYKHDPASELGLFTAQDHKYLCALFSINHDVDAFDAERVVKKERTVSTD